VLLPNHAEAIIAVGKTRDYLLDLEHDEGSSKARLLYRIGFRRDAYRELEAAIRELISQYDAIELPPRYGKVRYRVEGVLVGSDGSRRFRTVWVMDGNTPFLATAYPMSR
jgi:hypothetical protein